MKISKPTPAGALLAGAALVLSLAVAPAAFAGKGKPSAGGSSTISAPILVADGNGDGAPDWGDTVTFSISTTATTQPYIHLVCSGNGVAYDSWKGVFAGSLDTNWNFVLSSGGWAGGSASCTAWLGMYTKQGFKQLASSSFQAGA
jgi:hypothetical protein